MEGISVMSVNVTRDTYQTRSMVFGQNTRIFGMGNV